MPNIVVAPDKYLLTYACPDGVCPNPLQALGVSCKQINENDDLLLRFYMLLAQAISVTSVAHPPYHRYLAHLKQWDSNIFYGDGGVRMAIQTVKRKWFSGLVKKDLAQHDDVLQEPDA